VIRLILTRSSPNLASVERMHGRNVSDPRTVLSHKTLQPVEKVPVARLHIHLDAARRLRQGGAATSKPAQNPLAEPRSEVFNRLVGFLSQRHPRSPLPRVPVSLRLRNASRKSTSRTCVARWASETVWLLSANLVLGYGRLVPLGSHSAWLFAIEMTGMCMGVLAVFLPAPC
jgi:hypothetical protein